MARRYRSTALDGAACAGVGRPDVPHLAPAQRRAPRPAARCWSSGIEAVWAAEPEDISLLHVLFYIHSAGGFDAAVRHRGRRPAGPLRRRLAARADPPGGAARRRGHHLRARPADRTWRTTGSPCAPTAGRCAAGARSSRSRRRSPGGSSTTRRSPATATSSPSECRWARWSSAWPSTTSRSGARRDSAVRRPATSGPVKITFDNSPPDGTPGVLLGFLEGERARRLGRLPPTSAASAVIACFARLFGERAAARALHRALWAEEELTRGCYGCHLPPGAWTNYGDGAARADRPAALGGSGDRHGVDRLHGRRGAIRGGRGERGTGGAVSGLNVRAS